MKYKILLDRNEDTHLAEIQEQARFIKTIFEALDIPIEYNPDEPLTVEGKITLKRQLDKYRMNIIDNLDGGIKIYVENEVVGEWHKCKYKLKEDTNQINRKKKFYIEMEVFFETIFEGQNNEENIHP
jgi:hypothetical protein